MSLIPPKILPCHFTNLRNTQCHMSLINLLMSLIRSMFVSILRKCRCRRVEFKGQWPRPGCVSVNTVRLGLLPWLRYAVNFCTVSVCGPLFDQYWDNYSQQMSRGLRGNSHASVYVHSGENIKKEITFISLLCFKHQSEAITKRYITL